QAVGARLARVPVVTMMDYEFQPANHVSFRLASRVVLPEVFPAAAARRQGARNGKVLRYRGYKEELYLSGPGGDDGVAAHLGLDPSRVIVVMRAAPAGALYHRDENARFERLIEEARARPDVQVVLLPRVRERAAWPG